MVFAAGGAGDGGFLWSSRVPVLVGLGAGAGHEFTFGPSLGLGVGGGLGESAAWITLGGQVGFAAHVADDFRLVPQLDVTVPVARAASGDDGGAMVGADGLLFGFQLGLLLGGPE